MLPQISSYAQPDALSSMIERIVEQKLTNIQRQPEIDQKKQEIQNKPEYTEFIARLKKIVLNGLTLPQSGKLFMMAASAGEDRDKLFMDAILGFLSTQSGVAVLQMAVDEFLKEIDSMKK